MVKLNLKKYVSPIFLVLLFISLVLWYLTKLSYDYIATVPIQVEIENNRFRVECVAEGQGYRILAHRLFKQTPVNVRFTDLQSTPSVISADHYIINPHSLQSAISLNNGDLRIISVGEIPEIVIKTSDD
jgi:hypothetical protein